MVDAPRPLASKRKSKRLRFTYASIGVLSNISNESVNLLHKLNIAAFHKITVLLLRLACEDYSVHAMRFKKSSNDSALA